LLADQLNPPFGLEGKGKGLEENPLFGVHFQPGGLLMLPMNLNEAKARHAQLVEEIRDARRRG
jgi:hypothetical protein